MKRRFLYISIMLILSGCAQLDHPDRNARALPEGLGEVLNGNEQKAKK